MRFVKTAENNKNFVVYCHINKSNGKMYIGITGRNPSKRWANGKAYTHNKLFTNAILKYGWDGFYHTIIAKNLTMQEACTLENALVSRYKTYDIKNGYNLTYGGEINIMNDDVKKVISEKAKERMKNKKMREKVSLSVKEYYKNNPDAKKRISERSKKYAKEHKEDMLRASLFGAQKTRGVKKDKELVKRMLSWKQDKDKRKRAIIKIIEKNSIPVICLDSGIEYKSAREASRLTGILHSSITSCCRGKLKRAGGFKWRYKDQSRVFHKIKKKIFTNKTRRVICKETGMVFPSIKAAALFVHCNSSNISKCLKFKACQCRGFHWDYFKKEDKNEVC